MGTVVIKYKPPDLRLWSAHCYCSNLFTLQTTYQRQVLNDMSSDSDARTTPGLYSDNLLDSDELTHDLLLNALSTWRTTWYLDNKWRDSNLENLIVVRQLFLFLYLILVISIVYNFQF